MEGEYEKAFLVSILNKINVGRNYVLLHVEVNIFLQKGNIAPNVLSSFPLKKFGNKFLIV